MIAVQTDQPLDVIPFKISFSVHRVLQRRKHAQSPPLHASVGQNSDVAVVQAQQKFFAIQGDRRFRRLSDIFHEAPVDRNLHEDTALDPHCIMNNEGAHIILQQIYVVHMRMRSAELQIGAKTPKTASICRKNSPRETSNDLRWQILPS